MVDFVFSFVVCVIILSLFWMYTKSTSGIPRIYAKAGKFRTMIETRCPVLKEKYVPPFWCPFGSLQTAVRQLIKTSKALPFTREVLPLADGGQVGLDWFMPETYSDSTPIVVVLPGLTGSSSEYYILHLVEVSLRQGYKTVVFNNRGNGGVDLLTNQMYSAAYIDDFQAVVSTIRKKYQDAKILAVGFSLGGMILFNYVSKVSAEIAGLTAAFVISSPWDPFRSSQSLETFLNWIVFNRRLAGNLCRNLAKHRHRYNEKLNMDYVLSSQSIREFDERVIVPMFGYKNVSEYYEDAGLYNKVNKVVVPTLCLNAADDCFAPFDSIPLEDIQNSENVAVVVTNHGGHIAFLKGLTGLGTSLIEELFGEFSSAAFADL